MRGRLAAVEPYLRQQPQFQPSHHPTAAHSTSTTVIRRRPGCRKPRANLREIAPTIYFNVPEGLRSTGAALPRRPRPCAKLLQPRSRCCFTPALALNQTTWDELDATRRRRPPASALFSVVGLGSTETAPLPRWPALGFDRAGNIGLPAPGVELKLVPNEGKLEARAARPAHHAGLLAAGSMTREAFDDEGIYKLGDALKFADPE